MSVARAERSAEYFLGLENGLTKEEDEVLCNYRQIANSETKQFILSAAKNAPRR